MDGWAVGPCVVGAAVGRFVGGKEGSAVGCWVGRLLGLKVGDAEGAWVG